MNDRYPEPTSDDPPRPFPAMTTRLSRILLVPYTIAVLLIVWLPADEAGKVTGIVAALARNIADWGMPFDAAYTVFEFAANIALFVPLGVLLALGWSRIPTWAIIAMGCGSSIVIELVQLAIPSRYSTLSDVIANTLGTAGGVVVVRVIARLLGRNIERTRRLRNPIGRVLSADGSLQARISSHRFARI